MGGNDGGGTSEVCELVERDWVVRGDDGISSDSSTFRLFSTVLSVVLLLEEMKIRAFASRLEIVPGCGEGSEEVPDIGAEEDVVGGNGKEDGVSSDPVIIPQRGTSKRGFLETLVS